MGAIVSKRLDSPLGTRYSSSMPSKLGPDAMKFSARPSLVGVPPATEVKLHLAMFFAGGTT